jgi:putative membrane protein
MRFMNDIYVDSLRLILRDRLAIDRTALANERTLLAYLRTAMALLAGGGTLLRFFWGTPGILALGSILALLGVAVAGLGTWRYRTVAKHLHNAVRSTTGTTSSDGD